MRHTQLHHTYEPSEWTKETGDEDPFAHADMALSKNISETLMAHYPDHFWFVRVDCAQGVAFIRIPILMGATLNYILPLALLAGDPSNRCVMRAGGEILERYRIPRSGLEKGLPDFHAAQRKHRLARLHDPIPG